MRRFRLRLQFRERVWELLLLSVLLVLLPEGFANTPEVTQGYDGVVPVGLLHGLSSSFRSSTAIFLTGKYFRIFSFGWSTTNAGSYISYASSRALQFDFQ